MSSLGTSQKSWELSWLAFSCFLGWATSSNPEVPESYLEQNTRICIMMIITGLVAAYAIFRPFTGGFLLFICTVGLGFVFGGFLHNPITPVVLLCGGFFIFTGYLSHRKTPKELNKPS